MLHGDEFDGVVMYARWLNLPYWSLAAYLKHRTKKAVQYIAAFENAVAREART